MSFTATALITGGTSGLGKATARLIAQQRPDWRVLVVSRSGEKTATQLNAELRKTDGRRTPNIFFLPLDCSSLESVRRFVDSYASSGHPPLQALLLNAGVQIERGIQYSEDGYELTFATNHLGQALLFFLLQPHLADDAHIIYTGSGLHKSAQYNSAEKCAHPEEYPDRESAKEGRRRYALSKLVNALWLYALRRRVRQEGKKWTVIGYSPGLIPGTGLARDATPALRFIWTYLLPYMVPLLRLLIPSTFTPEESGRILARLALDDERLVGEDDAKAYWQPTGPVKSSEASYDKDKQEDLWDWTLKAVARDSAERERFSTLQ